MPIPIARRRHTKIGRSLLAATESLRGSDALRIFREVEPAPFLPRPALDALRWERLSKLLAHAEARVPYYREMFRKLKISSRDIRSMEDFSSLPVLTKDVVRARQKELLAEGYRPEQLVKHNSGGSTGVPLTFFHDKRSSWASDAAVYRNFAQAGWRPGEMTAMFYCGGQKLADMSPLEFELRQFIRRTYQFDPSSSGPAQWEKWLKRWKSLGATVLVGYPSALEAFCRFIEERGEHVKPIRGVFTSGEKLYPNQREIISRVFGCSVFDTYGSSEVRNLAAECPRGAMHLQEDYSIVEVEGRPAAGVAGPLLVTSLWNFGMPFLRYRNEDFGALSEGSCDCGRSFGLMQIEVGRVSDNFKLPDGSLVHGQFFTWLLYGSQGISSFQFHQTASDAITFYYVSGSGAEAQRATALERVRSKVGELAGGNIKLTMKEVTEIPKTSSGKHRFTRSDVQDARAAAQ